MTISKKFIYSDFFFNEKMAPVYKESRDYTSTENLKQAFVLEKEMLDCEIIQKLGGEEKVRANAVTMDQIEQLIKAQPKGIKGLLSTNMTHNIFYVIGVEDNLFSISVSWRIDHIEWRVSIYGIDVKIPCIKDSIIFNDKS